MYFSVSNCKKIQSKNESEKNTRIREVLFHFFKIFFDSLLFQIASGPFKKKITFHKLLSVSSLQKLIGYFSKTFELTLIFVSTCLCAQ